MSKLSQIYKEIKPSIVAIVGRVTTDRDFPPIIGTGFIAREDGLIFTNDHVIKAINHLPRRKGAKPTEWPATVLMFRLDPAKGMYTIPLNIVGLHHVASMSHSGNYYGPQIPDIGVIRVDINGLPSLKIAKKINLEEGDEIATSGFPMGTNTLKAPGWVHQLSPTLQKGIISTFLPFVCEAPHALMLDLVTEGGASGSPVFNIENGEVIGMIYAGLLESRYLTSSENSDGILVYKNSTSHTLAIPCNFLNLVLDSLEKDPSFKAQTIKYTSLEEILKTWEAKERTPKGPMFDDSEICEVEE